ncbi:MAG: S-layer homology domain-containing protein [Vallitalea sp.]|jgi:hypothetical protein|nr:S-layer homology domain-containing protein [Vallitalea sp.]
MKEKIMKIYNKHVNMDPSLKKENVMLMIEGLGNYKGIATKNRSLHPNGRMGAIFAVITKVGELFYTTSASTLPDIPMGPGKYNGNTPTPTLKLGTYKVYSKLHRGTNAMELGLGNQSVPVIRRTGHKTSNGIDLHSRPVDDYAYHACSAGCLNVVKIEFKRMLEILGVTKNGKFLGEGRYIGRVIVDRSFIDEDLQNLYKGIYGEYYSDIFNVTPIPKDIQGHWAENNIIGVIEDGLMTGYSDGSFQPNQPVTRAELAAVVARLKNKRLV